MKNKVYVIDYEIVSPLGIGKDAVLHSIYNNISAVSRITNFYAEELEINIGAEIKQDLSKFLKFDEPEDIQEYFRLERKFELMYVVYRLIESRLHKILADLEPLRGGVVLGIGAGTGLFDFIDHNIESIYIQGNASILDQQRYFLPIDIFSMFLAQRFRLAAFQQGLLTACAASNQALGWGAEAISRGQVDVVLAGGTDSIINFIGYIAFEKLGTLAMPDTQVENSCKPFDINRSGTVAGEAAGLVVLASENFVREHNLRPKFEILGYGSSLDAYMVTAPDPSGDGMARAMERAMEQAQIDLNQIGYINAHGTGTELNDVAEVKALNDVFGPALEGILVSSTKDRHGHAIAAAGVQEFIITALALENNFIPHTRNLHTPIQDRWFRPLMNKPVRRDISIAMNCSYGFGGVNSALIFKKIKS